MSDRARRPMQLLRRIPEETRQNHRVFPFLFLYISDLHFLKVNRRRRRRIPNPAITINPTLAGSGIFARLIPSGPANWRI